MDVFLLSPNDAAKALCISLKTLEAMRLRGTGPTYIKVSSRRIAYRRSDLEAFIKGRAFQSTSQYGQAA
ncbi:helix-turn-helix transcriptional regulator [Bosea thiooxidans]|uniref:helix-turn-helix transcriptional regulator n=1 Tax=Bosea thiooxidans TaxID=53254 RepID=UPI001115E049|nr:helix-turn-helix domain-containing protein [Bosea thiooxidans]